MAENEVKCRFCQKKALYTCPKCNIPYCSLDCYKSERHMACSETFYKDMVKENLQNEYSDSNSRKKMLEILERVERDDCEDSDDFLDSDDDEDLATRVKGINLDDSDALWSKLTDVERKKFLSLVESGDLESLVPVWKPWWEESKLLVEELSPLGNNGGKPESFINRVPSIVSIENTTGYNGASTSVASFRLFNVLAAYAWTARVFNGDHIECCVDASEMFLSLASALIKEIKFPSQSLAIAAVVENSERHSWLRQNTDFYSSIKRDVGKIVQESSESHLTYILPALSDILTLLDTCRTRLEEPAGASGSLSDAFPLEKDNAIPKVLVKNPKKLTEAIEVVKSMIYTFSYTKDQQKLLQSSSDSLSH